MLGQEQPELVASEPGDRVGGAQDLLQAIPQLLEQLVAGMVAEGVIDLLEAVEVHHQDGDPPALPARRENRLLDSVAQQRPVGKTREGIMERLVLVQLGLPAQLLLGLLALRDVLDHRDHGLRLAFLVDLEDGDDAGPDQLAVLPVVALLEPVRVAGSFDELVEALEAFLDIVGVGELRESHRRELRRGVAEHALERGVRFQGVSLQVASDDPDRCSLEHRAEAGKRFRLRPAGVELGGIADRRRQDDREQLERLEIPVGERVRPLREHRQDPDRVVAVPQGDGDDRPDPALQRERIGERCRVVADRGAVAAVDRAGEGVVDAEPAADDAGGEARAGAVDQLVAVLHEDRPGVGTRQLLGAFADEIDHRLQVVVEARHLALRADDALQALAVLVQLDLGRGQLDGQGHPFDATAALIGRSRGRLGTRPCFLVRHVANIGVGAVSVTPPPGGWDDRAPMAAPAL